MLKYSPVALMIIALGGLLPACAADIGEACDTRGSTDECVDGAVCDSATTSDAPVCLKICTDASQCASDEDCNGTSGSNIKACQPKTK